MKIVIVGAGEVGSNTAESLCSNHEVVIIERDSEVAKSLRKSLDILVIEGDGTSRSTLKEAGIENTDLFIASTDSDETNLVSCSTVKTISDVFSIARVKSVEYLDTWEKKKGVFGVDFMVCTNLLTAEDIVRFIGLPTAHDVDRFGDGIVQMAQLEIPPGSSIVNKTVEEADIYEEITFAAIIRDDSIEISKGNTVLRENDDIIIIGNPDKIYEFSRSIASSNTSSDKKDIVIIGGTEIGYNIAKLLEKRGIKPRLIEEDEDRARYLAGKLPSTVILENDPTDIDFLTREHIGDADIVISALQNDEKNLLTSLLAGRGDNKKSVTVVEKGEYVDLFEKVGIDVAISPREITAEEIIRFTRQERTENISLIESGKAEVIEIEIDQDSLLVNRKISESMKDLPNEIVIGAIIRDNKFITPRGSTVIKPKDHIVVFIDEKIQQNIKSKL